ncbi:MAG: DoxX family protein, partial [Chloroflexi bacterium]|nr:DoxX family protein [Chloroflexota bacterium]
SLYSMAIFYILAGLNHFRDPRFYLKMMPKYLPAHKELILASGAIEILLGAALFFEPIRDFALIGIILLLIAIFPANVEMLTSKNFKKIPLKWKVLRLPFQGVFIFWAYYHLLK